MKLPADFEKDNFALLTPVVTDGTLKNRRNLLVSSFSIALLYALDKSLSSIKVLGINLNGTSGATLTISAFLILIFWVAMFVIHALKDFNINKERKYLLIKQADLVKSRLDYAQDKFQALPIDHPNFKEIAQHKSEYDIFLNQQLRTKKARLLSSVSFVIEYSLPFILTFWCFYLLTADFLSTIKNT